MDNRRLMLAVLLSMVVVVVWQLTVAPPPEAPVVSERPGVAEGPVTRGDRAPAADEGSPEDPVDGDGRTGLAEDGEPATLEAVEEGGDAELEEVSAREEAAFVLEGEGFEATFTNRGAQLTSFLLTGYDRVTGEPIDMVRSRGEGVYPFGLVDRRGRGLEINEALFVAEEGVDDQARSFVQLSYQGPAGRATKRFTALPNGLLEVRLEGVEIERSDWGFSLGPGVRNPTVAEVDSQFGVRQASWKIGDELGESESADADEWEEVSGLNLSWVALEDPFFLTALVPQTEVDRVLLIPEVARLGADGETAERFEALGAEGPSEEQEELLREHRLVVMPMPGAESFSGFAYLGAKDLDRLADFPWQLDETVRFGYFGFFARWLHVGIEWIHDHLVANYGWAIVLMTLFIKLLLLPLTHKSYTSMQRMQELSPKMNAIRARYKGKLRDKKGRPDMEAQRKMNEEVAALYREEGVNPISGCLPMLLQFPVLFGFYKLLLNSVELRGAPWVLWIDDLSTYDPYFVLPIVMGAVQFLQQKTAPAVGDPRQRRIMMLLPVFFTILFLKFPSGLVLYWLTNNLLTLVQQVIYRRLRAGSDGDPGAKTAAKKS